MVRNLFRTRTFDRAAVAAFRPGRAPRQVIRVTCIFLVGGNGAGYPLDGTLGVFLFRRRTADGGRPRPAPDLARGLTFPLAELPAG